MPRKQFTSEQIITKLREAEVLWGQGMTVIEAVRKLEIGEQTYFRWRKEYGGLDTTKARKLKELGKENLQLKKLVADLIVIEGLRGESTVAKLCRREGIAQSLYYKWSKEFLEAGKTRQVKEYI